MRAFTKILAIAATMLLACSVSATTPGETKIPMESMTVPQLEAAGDSARTNKDYDLAIRYLQAAIRKDSRNAMLYNKLGLAQLKAEKMPEARSSFQKSAKLNSKFPDPVNNMGALEYMQKRYGPAAKYFKKAVALDETKATFHVNLGATWFAQKKFDRAIAEYSRALELNPNALATSNSGVRAQIASPEERAKYAYMLAKLYAKRGQYDECMQSLRKAKEEGYKSLSDVYKDAEFASLRTDPKLAEIVGTPAK
jgi:tetratricopeptide (TPR) repeat protein